MEGREGREGVGRKGKGKGGMERVKESKREGGSGRGDRIEKGRDGSTWMSRGSEFLVTPLVC